ncbi:hypothetical protein ACIRP3_01890 [Streptomyces sp. NPDC101209]|uniref:hypothetical protein n=1 Tax=Streptomyces sp. NPDC101209 TaxID=3366129 RepID=UPI00380BD708
MTLELLSLLPSLDPTGSGLVGRCRGGVERDGRLWGVPPHQVDDLLEEFHLIVRVPQTTADGHALPPMGSQGITDDYFYVVTSVKADEAGLDGHVVFGELGQSHLDRFGYRLGVPRPGQPIRIKPDDKDAGGGSGVHVGTIRADRPGREGTLKPRGALVDGETLVVRCEAVNYRAIADLMARLTGKRTVFGARPLTV